MSHSPTSKLPNVRGSSNGHEVIFSPHYNIAACLRCDRSAFQPGSSCVDIVAWMDLEPCQPKAKCNEAGPMGLRCQLEPNHSGLQHMAGWISALQSATKGKAQL